MTPRQYRSLGRYVRLIADRLGLRDWTFEISHNPSDGIALAQIECLFGRQLGIVEFCPNWMGLTPEQQRHVVVHEMLHACAAGPHGYVYRALPSLLGESAWSAFESAYRQVEELATDGLAAAIAPIFPLWEG